MANSPIRTTSRLRQSIHTSIYSADDIFIYSKTLQRGLCFGRNLWCKFWLGIVSSQFGGKGGLRGLEMGPLSSPVVTSYGLPIVG